jgi:hypothetical protein
LEAAAAAAIEEASRRNAAPAIRLRTIVDSAIGSLARLRRPGVLDGPAPATRPLNGPAPASGGPPAVAPPYAAAEPEDSSVAPIPEDVLQPSPDPEMANPTDEAVADVNRPELPRAAQLETPVAGRPWQEPLLDLAPADDGREQAGASSQVSDAPADAPSVDTRSSVDPRLEAVAHLCTEFGRVGNLDEVQILLEDSAGALDARGLIVWLWDESSEALWPALVHGYSDQVLAHLPTVRRDADNATAEAFRSASACEVTASAQATGALVLPLLIPEGCAGVLAVELQRGLQPPGSLRALAMVLAAALAQLVHRSRPTTADTRLLSRGFPST